MRKLIISILLLCGVSVIANEQQYHVVITITKDCTLSEAIRLAEKYGNDGVISITPIKVQQDSGFFFFPRRQWIYTDTIDIGKIGTGGR